MASNDYLGDKVSNGKYLKDKVNHMIPYDQLVITNHSILQGSLMING